MCGVLTLVATVVPLSLSWARDYPMFALGQDEKTMDYSINFYIVPWCRYQVTELTSMSAEQGDCDTQPTASHEAALCGNDVTGGCPSPT